VNPPTAKSDGPAGDDRPVTMADVARLAGVSPATVSRCLNGAKVSPRITEAVNRAIAQLGYRPNLIARGLRKQVSNVWACVISDIENQFFTAMVRGVEDVAREVRHSVVLCNTDEDIEREAEYLRLIVSQRMAGVIISATRNDTDITALTRTGVQVVSIDRQMTEPTDTVLVDSHEGAQAATAHLIAKGCRRIACITGPRDTTTGEERLRGYRAALRVAGFPVNPDLERHCDFKEAGAFAAALELLAQPDRPDGFFVANNQMTLGVLRALEAENVMVPTETAVAGFDDLPWWPMSRPSITAVAQPAYEMGRAAGQMLAERIAGYEGPPRSQYFEARLIERQSSCLGTRPNCSVASCPGDQSAADCCADSAGRS
jgi:LacI family transcriptional regulator